jgi:hypothetical protein
MSGLNDPALHLFGVPLAIGLTLFLGHLIGRWRTWRRRNREIALRRSEWRRLNDWKPEE